MIGPQLWLARKDGRPSPDRMKPVRAPERPSVKPRCGGGLWTSTYQGDHGSGWVQWCIDESFDGAPSWGSCWLLTPSPRAQIYEIDSYADLQTLCRLYGRTETFGEGSPFGPFHNTYPDWSLVAERYDGVHLTDAGQWATRLSCPLDLYGWDCESTLWFRWAFDAVEELGPRTFVPQPDEVALAS